MLAALTLAILPIVASDPGESMAAGLRTRQASACIFDHMTLQTVPGTCRPRAKRYPPQVVGTVRHDIYDSALIFGIPYSILLELATCESGLNPRAVNGDHYGLFQFVPQTFHLAARQMRRETGIAAHSYWNPLDASYAAGYLFATGEAPRWQCEYP